MTDPRSRSLDELIERFDAGGDLSEFASWAAKADGDLADAWASCPAGEWLLWLAAAVGAEGRHVARAGCACVREALKARARSAASIEKAVEAAEAWSRGEGSVQQCDDAGYQVYSSLVQGAGAEDDGWAAGVADAAVWVASLVVRLPDPDGMEDGEIDEEARHEYASSALMAALRAAEALAHQAVPGALVTSAAWQTAFDRGRARCAELVRATLPFELVGPCLDRALDG